MNFYSFNDLFYFDKAGPLPSYKSKNLSYPHIFSTRLGGVSQEDIYKSLNLGYHRGDERANVDENISRFAAAVGSTPEMLVTADQVHSANVRAVTKDDAGKIFENTDGFVTREKNIPISVSVADCAPILLEDRENGVVAALHAGWRGTVSGIASEGVKKMLILGADIKNINAAIGPCIHKCCYTVGEDFFNTVVSLRGNDFAKRHIFKSQKNELSADITSMNGEILLENGILPENISISSKCTSCESNIFFSHRASKGKRGAMKAAIMIL